MNRRSATRTNRCPHQHQSRPNDTQSRPYDTQSCLYDTQSRPHHTQSKGFNANVVTYPGIVCLLAFTISLSLMSFSVLIANVVHKFDDPPFKIEIETNSSSETALNETAMRRQFNKIYTYLTSVGSDEVSVPSYKINVKNEKIDSGIAFAVFFLCFITFFIGGLALYGIDMEEPKLIIPFHIYWHILSIMAVVLSLAVIARYAEKEYRNNPALFKSPSILREEVTFLLGITGWFGLMILEFLALHILADTIRSELEEMRIAKKRKTPRP